MIRIPVVIPDMQGDEILLVHPHDGVWPDEEETKLLEGIKKIHNLNYFA